MKILVFLLSLATAIGSFVTFGREYDIAYFSRSPDTTIFSEIANHPDFARRPLSSRGMRELVTACGDVQLGLMYRLQTPEVQDAVDTHCARMAKAILRRNPTYSGAHTIAMLSAKDAPQIVQSAILSQMTAPFESWNAKLRLGKALSLFGTQDPDLDRALQLDITFLMQSQGGRVWLAALYKRQVSARPVLAKIIDERPYREKASFLNEVRKLG